MARSAIAGRGGIRIRMVGLVLICLIPLLLVLLVSAARQRDESRRDAKTDALRLARQAGQREAAVIGNARTLLTGAAALWRDASEGTTCQSFVDSVVDQSPLLTNVFAVGGDGQVICSAEPLPGQPVLIDRDYVQTALTSSSFSASLEMDPALVPEPSLAAILPIPDDPDVALLGATMDLGSTLEPFLDNVGLPEASEALLIDRTGHIVASTSDSSPAGEVLPAQSVTTKVATDQVVEGSSEAKGLDGMERIYGFADVPLTGRSAFALVGIPSAEAFAASERELRTNLIAAAIVSLVAVTLALAAAELAVARPVRSILGTIRKIGAGDLGARTDLRGGANELVEVGRTIDVMAEDINAREDALLLAADEREHLLAELLDAQEEERRKIAADIHDDTIQTMIAASMEVQLLRIQLGEAVPGDRLRSVERAIGTAVTRLRHLMFELEPPDSDSTTIAESVEQYVESALGEGPMAIAVEAGSPIELTGPARQVLFRNVRESALNASRHGGAANVSIQIDLSDGGVLVSVHDDGSGLSEQDTQKPGHHGLRVMRERTEALAGWFRLESGPGQGTTVSFWLPLAAAPA